jgi:hypothetical protein
MSAHVIDEATIPSDEIDIKLHQETEYAITYSIDDSEDLKKKSLSQKLSLIFASIALGSDGYQANIIGAVERCLSKIYGPNVLSNGLSTRVSNAMLIGDIVGQVGFGIVIDRFGRKFGIIACTLFVCIASSLIVFPFKGNLSDYNHDY